MGARKTDGHALPGWDMKTGYVIENDRWEALNHHGDTYWWVYIEEILDRMGLTAEPVHKKDLSNRLHQFRLLFLGNTDASDIADCITAWVESGGTLVGSLTTGLDALFGIKEVSRASQPEGDFSIAAGIDIRADRPETRGIRFPANKNLLLPIASEIRQVRPTSPNTIHLAQAAHESVITARNLGSGRAFYFGFDLAKTFWVVQQGRPVDSDYDGDGYLRTGDALVIGDFEPEIPCTDELLILLERLVGSCGMPLVHRLPPSGDQVPDALFYYGGDDEGSTGVQIPAAEFMNSRGLPYHINCMLLDGRYGLSARDISRLDELGVELSPHFNFINGFEHPTGFGKHDLHSQARAFGEYFGRQPLTSNFHWCRWTGYHEPAIWLSEIGIRGDNSFVHRRLDVLNPVNTIGFAFGTAFPFHIYAPGEDGNCRTPVIELPITAYEVGYTKEGTDYSTLERAFDLAIHYGLTMNFFYHPVYISQNQYCRKAIDRLLEYARQRHAKVVHFTPDTLVKWWEDRGRTRITHHRSMDGGQSFLVQTPSPIGCIVKVAYTGNPPKVALPHRVFENSTDLGWIMIVVPPGETEVELKYV